ncbi:MAG TPA: efflux RND transporter periplasmic adaptor subunit [Steroidobacteraceae bacterium]|nr:efflux RND transporter periplasmic adaptor subunit [Steroidobacteraceae bacterium]
MKSRTRFYQLSALTTFAALAMVSALSLSACAPSMGHSTANAAKTPPAAQVTVAEVIHRPLRDWSEFTGRLEAVQSVEIRPRVSGYIDRIGFEEGVRVKKGQILFRIDPRPFRAEAERQLAARTRARSELDLAKANHARAQRLIGENAISREEFERLSSADAVAASDLAAANAALSAAKLNLEFTEVRAPIDGRVSRALITQGNLVSSDSLLTTIVSDDPVYATFDADEQTFLRYSRNAANRTAGEDPVYMGLTDEKDFPHRGRLNFVDNQVDRKTGTIRTRAVFANPDGIYTPGLFVRIRLVGRDTRDAVLIDDRAVGTDLGKKFVFVLKNDSTVDYRGVTLGPDVDGLRVVDSGLGAGEVIVINGLQRVRPGVSVSPTKVVMDMTRNGLRQVAAVEPDGSAGKASPAHGRDVTARLSH